MSPEEIKRLRALYERCATMVILDELMTLHFLRMSQYHRRESDPDSWLITSYKIDVLCQIILERTGDREKVLVS